MLSVLERLTSLPNLHPALVHFPIALAPTAVLFDVAAILVTSWRRAWSRTATALWILAAVGAGVSWWAGHRAADSVVDLSVQAQARIGDHSDLGLATLWAFGILAVLRVLATPWLDKRATVLAVAVVVGLGGCVLVARTADLGGGLVYELGVAVKRPETTVPRGETDPEAPSSAADQHGVPPEATSPTARLETRDDGSVVWKPDATDAAALGLLLTPADGFSLDPVRAIEASLSNASGLTLEVAGRTLLVLPGTFRDVGVAAEVDLDDFAGSFGLAHHVASANRAGLLEVVPATGRFVLATLEARGERRVHAEESTVLSAGTLRLAVTAAGRHLRGTLGGELVVHGHVSSLPAGRVGLLLDGTGQVRIVSLRVTPIAQ